MADFLGALVGLGAVVLFVVAWTKIFTKAGFSPWMGIAMVVPIVKLFVFLALAFTEWPVHARLRAAAMQGAPIPPGQASAGTALE